MLSPASLWEVVASLLLFPGVFCFGSKKGLFCFKLRKTTGSPLRSVSCDDTSPAFQGLRALAGLVLGLFIALPIGLFFLMKACSLSFSSHCLVVVVFDRSEQFLFLPPLQFGYRFVERHARVLEPLFQNFRPACRWFEAFQVCAYGCARVRCR